MEKRKVILVIDWLDAYGGAEKIVKIFTSVI